MEKLDLTNQATIRALLKEYGIRPQKRWGQHFLVSSQALSTILAAADLKASDTVLEVGPGIGTLTLALARRVRRVIAIEKDRRLSALLKDLLKKEGIENVEILEGDALRKIQDSRQGQGSPKATRFKIQGPYKVVSNLPYNIAVHMLRICLESERQPELLVVTVQKEVGERICATPPKMTLLALAVQFYATANIVAFIPRSAFWPQPDVDGAILKILPHKKPVQEALRRTREKFFAVAKAGFAHPRKQLIGALLHGTKIERPILVQSLAHCGIYPTQRPQELAIRHWQCLAQSLFIHKRSR